VRDARGEPGHWVCHYQNITDRKALEERLRYQALHDPLTGLPGRELLTGRLRRILELSRRREESVAVLFLDVDNLKIVNDSLGHEVGDRLLREVGERLRECVRAEDTVARFGGDEFVVLLDRPGSEEESLLVVRRMLDRLEEPLPVNGYEVPLTMSVGIAFSAASDSPGSPSFGETSARVSDVKSTESTENAESAEGLIRHADTAMYRAKAAGGGGYTVFDADLERDDSGRLELSSDLHRAIERGELRTYYQHKVDLSTGRVTGWEALLRWEHPERGLISPETFIPLAEETGLIIPIGKWVLEEACEQASLWRKRFPKEPGQFMSVNLSAKQFADPGLEGEIARILERTGLPAGALDLEITERVLFEDELHEFARVRKLKDSGLSFSLDDFGTGYSSLLSLKQLPADFVKIDRSFVERVPGSVEDEAFVTVIVSLARALGIKVVAEGIETESQWRRLRELGCEYGQGYHFSPPLPSEEASRSMKRLEDEAGA
jgi:diguanylate cyclase (GGDEF)-like protein